MVGHLETHQGGSGAQVDARSEEPTYFDGGREFFTVVFKGDIRKLRINPLTAANTLGEIVAAGIGDTFLELDVLRDALEPICSEFAQGHPLIVAGRDALELADTHAYPIAYRPRPEARPTAEPAQQMLEEG